MFQVTLSLSNHIRIHGNISTHYANNLKDVLPLNMTCHIVKPHKSHAWFLFFFNWISKKAFLTASRHTAYQWVVLSEMEPLSSGSRSRIAPGCCTLHNTPAPAVMSGCSLSLAGPGRRKKVMGSPSTVINRTGEMFRLAPFCCSDTMVKTFHLVKEREWRRSPHRISNIKVSLLLQSN